MGQQKSFVSQYDSWDYCAKQVIRLHSDQAMGTRTNGIRLDRLVGHSVARHEDK